MNRPTCQTCAFCDTRVIRMEFNDHSVTEGSDPSWKWEEVGVIDGKMMMEGQKTVCRGEMPDHKGWPPVKPDIDWCRHHPDMEEYAESLKSESLSAMPSQMILGALHSDGSPTAEMREILKLKPGEVHTDIHGRTYKNVGGTIFHGVG